MPDVATTDEERAFMRAVVAGLADLEAGREQPLAEAKARLNFMQRHSGATPPTLANLELVTAPGVAVTRQVVEAIREMPATEQGLIIGRLVSEISTARTVEQALYARRLLLPGRQVPEVYATEVARQHADTAIAELDKEIESLLFETRVRREVVSDTVTVLLERAAARRQASLNVPQGEPIDPRPLSNGRVQ